MTSKKLKIDLDPALHKLIQLIDFIDNHELGEGAVTVGNMRQMAELAMQAMELLHREQDKHQ